MKASGFGSFLARLPRRLRVALVLAVLALAGGLFGGVATQRSEIGPLEAGVGAGTAGSGPATAAADSALPQEGPFRVVEIVDGDTLVLDSGREVRLVGIQAPKLPLGRKGFEAWPLAEEAKAALAEIALGQKVRLRLGQQPEDRHGRILAHIDLADGTWVQGEMLSRGMARVYSFADNRALVAEMLAREGAARAADRGIWALAYYRPRQAVELAADSEGYLDRFELVEGRVLNAAEVRGRGYLNFGADWHSDFTASLAPEVMRRFAAEGIALSDYQDRRLRLRGWLKSYNGPLIEITHPEQIELLDE
ncbi:MAG TPA: thermonuclease family protein [Kiloniellaceae bacterium]|nr:thermonuclease family protein [Kiloniellaceae bacterium]